MNRAIVLVSGGMDSLVCAACAAADCKELNFLHFNYKQRTEKKELACFESLVKHYAPQRAKVVDYNWLGEIGGSALTDTSIKINTFSNSAEIPNTYVPFRNATMLSAAVAWAEVINADAIYIGAVEEDSSGYPDCREQFFRDFSATIASGTKKGTGISIVTPVLHLSKAEIVKMGMRLDAPFHLSWSCYASNDLACGSCDSCHLRLKAFARAGYTDPISYRE